MDWSQIDFRMADSSLSDADQCAWYDPHTSPFEVRGLWGDQEDHTYHRLPQRYDARLSALTPALSELNLHTSGGQIAFQTDSDRFAIAVKLSGVHSMDHFTAVGECGFDLYLAYPGEGFHLEGVTRFNQYLKQYTVNLCTERGTALKRVILNFPLYMGVQEVHIGLSKGARVLPPEALAGEKPLVFYGTSITQGGCASRPGMLYTNILSRALNREIYNFGFSGNGKGQADMARMLADVPSPALYFLNYEANSHTGMYDTLPEFLSILRSAHPTVPIVLCSRVYCQGEAHDAPRKKIRDEIRAFQKSQVEKLNAQGDHMISFVDGTTLMQDADECFVDGVHPTDLGFWQIARALLPVIQNLL